MVIFQGKGKSTETLTAAYSTVNKIITDKTQSNTLNITVIQNNQQNQQPAGTIKGQPVQPAGIINIVNRVGIVSSQHSTVNS